MYIDVNVNVTYDFIMAVTDILTSDPKWGVQAFADLFEVTPRAVRFYEDKGLITPSRENGSRVFDKVDYIRFSRILRAKRLGFSLDDIKDVLDVMDGRVKDRVELMRRRKNFGHVIKALSRRRQDIDELTREMKNLCDQIDEHLTQIGPDDYGLAFAADYEAVFDKHFADEFASGAIIKEKRE